MKKIILILLLCFTSFLSVNANENEFDKGMKDYIKSIGADLDTYEQINLIIGKDKNNLYIYGEKQNEDINLNSIKVLGENYFSDGNYIYFFKMGEFLKTDINPDTFIENEKYNLFGHDNINYYFKGIKIGKLGEITKILYEGCLLNSRNIIFCYNDNSKKYFISKSNKTFQKLSDKFGADNKKVYDFSLWDIFSSSGLKDRKSIIISNNPDGFSILNSKYYINDGKVFYISYLEDKEIIGADYKTFNIYKDSEYFAYDKNNIYNKESILEGEKPETFNLNEYLNELQKTYLFKTYLILIVYILLELLLTFITYNIILKNKKVLLGLYTKITIVIASIIPLIILFNFIPYNIISKDYMFILYLFIGSFIIIIITKKITNNVNIKILKDTIILGLATILFRIIFGIILGLIIGSLGYYYFLM